jgi:hypothetical protein
VAKLTKVVPCASPSQAPSASPSLSPSQATGAHSMESSSQEYNRWNKESKSKSNRLATMQADLDALRATVCAQGRASFLRLPGSVD